MEPRFEDYARAVFDNAGIAVTDADFVLVALIHAGYAASVAVLDAVDPTRFPFEPIDPSQAPEP